MAEEALLRLRAKDETKAAFASVKQSVDGLRGQLATLGVGLSVGGFAAFLKGSIDLVASLDDLSERTSLSVGFLSQLQQTARIGGHDLETIADAASKFTKSIGQAEDKTSEQAKAFQALGINLRNADGSLRKTEELFVEFAQVMTFADNKSRAFAAAMPIIGRSAAQLQPVFADIAKDGLRAARVTEEQAEAAEKLQKQLAELGNAYDGVRIAIGNVVIGPMTDWIKANQEATRIAGSATEALRLFVFNLEALTTDQPVEQIKRLSKALEDYQKAGKIGRFLQSPTGALFGGREEDLKKQIEFLKYLDQQQQKRGLSGTEFEGYDEAVARASAGITGASTRAIGALGDQAAALKAAKEAAEKFRKEQELLAKTQQELFPVSEWEQDYGRMLRSITQLYERFNSDLERAALEADEKFQAIQRRQGERVQTDIEKSITGETGIEVFVKNVKEEVDAVKEAAADMGVAVTGAFADAIVEGEKFSGVLKGLLKDILRILAQKFIVEKIASGISGILGSVFSGIFGSAGGGPISAGRPRLVGEQGPEIFVPDRSGMIVPNQSIGGGVTVNVNVSAGVAATVRSEIAQMLPAIQRATTAGVADSRQRGNAALRG